LQNEEIHIILIGSVFSAVLFFLMIRAFRKKRLIEDSHRSNIGTAPQGFVELQGFAWPKDHTMPLENGFKGVYYSFQLQREETRGSGKNKRKVWVTVHSHSFCHPFYLVDGTGIAEVDVHTASLELESPRTRRWGSLSSSEQKHFLDQVITSPVGGFPPGNFFWGLFSTKYRIVESEIRVGSPIYANGEFKSGTSEPVLIKSPGLSDFSKKVFDATTKKMKNLSGRLDKNNDGKVSAKEAQSGYTFAAKLAIANTTLSGTDESDFQLFGHLSSSSEHKLFLADQHENHLTAKLQKKVVGFAAAGVAGLVFAAIPFWLPQKSQSVDLSSQITPPAKTVNQLHYECVNKVKPACHELLQNKDRFKLRKDHVDYYNQQLSR
jgi:hypothetical protein